MSFASRVARNLARRKIRTVAVALIVGVSLAMFLILSQITSGIEDDINAAKAAVQDVLLVTVAGSSPTGGGCFFHGGSSGGSQPTQTYITANLVPILLGTPNVVSAQDVLTNTTGCPTSAPSQGSGFNPSLFQNLTTFEGISLTSNGTDGIISEFGGASTLNIVQGSALTPADENLAVADISQTYATNHDLGVNSILNINGAQVGVQGIYSSSSGAGGGGFGGGFGGGTILMPYPALQGALDAPGPSYIYVTVDDAADISTVIGDLTNASGPHYLGADYEVQSPGSFNGGQFESAIDSVVSSTQLEEYAALAVGAGVMVLVMVLMTAQRTREIGLLKAFGFSNGKIFAQLLLESVCWSVLGLPIGLVASVWLGPTVATDLASSSAQSTSSSFGGHTFVARGPASFLFSAVSFSLTPEVIALGVLVTVGFGVIGAAYPILRALRLRPAEALRHE